MNTQHQNDFRVRIYEKAPDVIESILLDMFNMIVELQEELESTARKLDIAEDSIFDLEKAVSAIE